MGSCFCAFNLLLLFSVLMGWDRWNHSCSVSSSPQNTVPRPDRSIAVRWQQEEKKFPPFVATNEQDRQYVPVVRIWHLRQ
ncbi:hypothetical protein B0H14DRAFT_2864093 [Mycena olivaceomarginata]|nr:hypothetical protein B0H14DRAFT_2864093 [Mycena olivaceomarginata]